MHNAILPKIFDYFDYVKYLRDYYEARHAADRWFSYRYIQSKTGIDPGYLFKIFQGKKPLPRKTVAPLARIFGLTDRQLRYFLLLVDYAKATSNEEIKTIFEKLLSFAEVAVRKVDVKEYEYYTKWYYAAVRQILASGKFSGDFEELAAMTIPPITAGEAKKAVTMLDKIGFVTRTPDGMYQVAERFLTTGENWHSIAIRAFQQETIMLAHQALDTVHKDERDISTVTVTLSEDGFREVRERIKQFRHDLLELASRQENVANAYHVNIQLIPIARLPKGVDQ
jgi:uncharacterized protein (TIGR02147 family)